MNQRINWLKERIRLYEEKRQQALYTRPYDDAIETYKKELEKEECQ